MCIYILYRDLCIYLQNTHVCTCVVLRVLCLRAGALPCAPWSAPRALCIPLLPTLCQPLPVAPSLCLRIFRPLSLLASLFSLHFCLCPPVPLQVMTLCLSVPARVPCLRIPSWSYCSRRHRRVLQTCARLCKKSHRPTAHVLHCCVPSSALRPFVIVRLPLPRTSCRGDMGAMAAAILGSAWTQLTEASRNPAPWARRSTQPPQGAAVQD